jgi:hypothetical protein
MLARTCFAVAVRNLLYYIILIPFAEQPISPHVVRILRAVCDIPEVCRHLLRFHFRPLVFTVIEAAEESAEHLDPIGVFDQSVPEIVANLVPDMTEVRSIQFAQLHVPFLAFVVVGLDDEERDHAIRMSV